MPSEQAILRAQQAIDHDEQVIYDVAARLGQHVTNVYHMKSFVRLVAEEFMDEEEAA